MKIILDLLGLSRLTRGWSSVETWVAAHGGLSYLAGYAATVVVEHEGIVRGASTDPKCIFIAGAAVSIARLYLFDTRKGVK